MMNRGITSAAMESVNEGRLTSRYRPTVEGIATWRPFIVTSNVSSVAHPASPENYQD